ncbi:hypothetical protein CPB86DRAFT_771500 [Serendipita vermifera]|nr:hypothetical protein CPB86DRAFT_771500 [Serendipita vermifera]
MSTSESNPLDGIADYIRKIRERGDKFRVLIIGRANAGKTTILQRTCNTTENPVIYGKDGKRIDPSVLESSAARGLHDIENEMVFKSRPSFRFHDSRGFESGGIEELMRVKSFIENRIKQTKLEYQLHVIWYCIPVDDSRLFTAAEQQFFAECGNGDVPIIIVFTKFDALDNKAFKALRDEKVARSEALRMAPKRALEDFETVHQGTLSEKFQSTKDHVYLRDMNKETADVSLLMTRTADALDNKVLQQLFVSTQRNNLELCIRYALEK